MSKSESEQVSEAANRDGEIKQQEIVQKVAVAWRSPLVILSLTVLLLTSLYFSTFPLLGFSYPHDLPQSQEESSDQVAVCTQASGAVFPVTPYVLAGRLSDLLNSTPESHGTAVLVTLDGEDFLVTNYHVLSEALGAHVRDHLTWATRSSWSTLDIVASDKDRDLALLSTDRNFTPGNYPKFSLDDFSLKVEPGNEVIALGWPGSSEGDVTFTKGIVSRTLSIDGRSFIQTDAAINPGNSGGALVIGCKLAGINVMKNINSEGIGFAIPTEDVIDFIRNRAQKPHVPTVSIARKCSIDTTIWSEIGHVSRGSEIGRAVDAPGSNGRAFVVFAEGHGVYPESIELAVDRSKVQESTFVYSRLSSALVLAPVEGLAFRRESGSLVQSLIVAESCEGQEMSWITGQ